MLLPFGYELLCCITHKRPYCTPSHLDYVRVFVRVALSDVVADNGP